MIAADDRGFTLTELLVSITLMTLVSGAIIASTVAVQRNLGAANATMNDMRTARLVVERVGQVLRGGVSIDGTLSDATAAIVDGTPSSVIFYSSTGRTADLGTNTVFNPMRVQLVAVQQADDGQWDLIERLWFPTAATDTVASGLPTFTSTPTRQRTLVRDLARTDLFTYWTHYGDDFDAGIENEDDARTRCGREVGPTLTTDEQRRAIDSVSFRLVVQEPTGYISSPADLQGWSRFASARDVGYSPTLDSAGCVSEYGFAYGTVYQEASP